VKTKLSRVVPLPTYVISSGLRQFFFNYLHLLSFLSFFFIEETTSNQAGLQDSMEKQIACCKNSSNYWTSSSQSMSCGHVLLSTASITTGTTQRGHNSSDNDTIGTGPSNLQRHLSVSEPTEAWATLQGSISFWTNWSMSNPARKKQNSEFNTVL